jgi:hypothetical protein
VVIVGDRGDSQTYVRMKKAACKEVGIASFGADLPATATQQEVLDTVAGFNANPDVHGILVQLPVRRQLTSSSRHSCLLCTASSSATACMVESPLYAHRALLPIVLYMATTSGVRRDSVHQLTYTLDPAQATYHKICYLHPHLWQPPLLHDRVTAVAFACML